MFSSKFYWKNVINAKFDQERDNAFILEVLEENLDPFLCLHSEVKPNYCWRCQKYPHLLPACKSGVKLISLLFCRNPVSVCWVCETEVRCYVHHRIIWCPNNAVVRLNMWAMLRLMFSFGVFVKLASKDVTEFVKVLLGAYELLPDALDYERIEEFYCFVASFIHELVTKCEKNILSPSMHTADTKIVKKYGIDVETTLWC